MNQALFSQCICFVKRKCQGGESHFRPTRNWLKDCTSCRLHRTHRYMPNTFSFTMRASVKRRGQQKASRRGRGNMSVPEKLINYALQEERETKTQDWILCRSAREKDWEPGQPLLLWLYVGGEGSEPQKNLRKAVIIKENFQYSGRRTRPALSAEDGRFFVIKVIHVVHW